MKIKTLFFAAVALLLAASCQKAPLDKTVVEGNDKVIFDITVADNVTKAVDKTAWTNGDQIVCLFKGDVTLGHQLRLTFDGTKWNAAFDDDSFIDQLVSYPDKQIYAVHWEGSMTFKTGTGNLEAVESLSGKTLLQKSDIPFTATQSGEKIIFKATISLERNTNFQVVLTDVPSSEASLWEMSSKHNWPESVRYGGFLLSPKTVYFNGSLLTQNSFYQVAGNANADGAAFLCNFQNFNSDIPLFFTHPSIPAKTYIKIIPEGQFAVQSMEGAFRTTLASCWEVTDTTGYVCDADFHYYRTKKMKDGKWWMVDNMRLVPEGLMPNDDFTTNVGGIWYPYKTEIVEGSPVVTVAKDAASVRKYGYFYLISTALGESAPSSWSKDYTPTNNQGICPTGWHIPALTDWINLVGKCNNKAVSITTAPYYNSSTEKGDPYWLNRDQFNIMGYGFVTYNAKTGYNAQNKILNMKDGDEFKNQQSLTYWASSTGYSATQTYALMFSNLAAGPNVLVGYNNLANAISVRCVKNVE